MATDRVQRRLAAILSADVVGYSRLMGRDEEGTLTRLNADARSLFASALNLDPSYAAAHAGIGFVHINDYINGWSDDPEQSLDTGIAAAERAIEMDPDEMQGHFTLAVALLFRREHDKALEKARLCLSLAPSSSEGHMVMANILTYSGKGAESIAVIETYRQLDPHYPDLTLYFLADAQVTIGALDDAVSTLKQRLDRNPNSETSYALLASCYGHLGRPEEARAAWEQVLRLAPNYSIERRRRVLPFKDPAVFERRIAGLRKAGISV